MATQSAIFKFALPEDENSDQLYIYSSSTEAGSYSTVSGMPLDYDYGDTEQEYDSLNDILWYKVRFCNSDDGEYGPYSDPVYGGNFSNAAPFLAVSSATDGANYASTQDVYDYSSLTPEDVTQDRVSKSLRSSRAIVDLRTADLELDRLTAQFDSDIARKKFNATLRIIKEAEINLALGSLFMGLSDDFVIERLRDALSGVALESSKISVGQTELAEAGGLANTEHMKELKASAERFTKKGMDLLASIQPTSVTMSPNDGTVRSPKFRLPFNGY